MLRNIYAELPAGSRTIRLLELIPGSRLEAVKCTLHESSLGENRSYKALSYVWKNHDAAPTVPIICNEQTLHVSENLYLALQRLRHSKFPVILWVDALCINQADDAERTHQVGMMREVYEYSSEVVIWLGERSNMDDLGELCLGTHQSENPDVDSRIAKFLRERPPKYMRRPYLETLETYRQTEIPKENEALVEWHDDERDWPKIDSYTRLFTKSSTPFNVDGPVDIFGAFCLIHQLSQGVRFTDVNFFNHIYWSERVVKGLWAIMDLPWWRRVWVVQETVVAQKSRICYSNLSAPWTMFSKAAANYARDRISDDLDLTGSQFTHDPLVHFSRNVAEIKSTKADWSCGQPITLLSLLRKFRSRDATDKRDKVFALLGLVKSWGYGNIISPDYSLTIEQVFFETTVRIIANTRSLSILCGTIQKPDGTLKPSPSWVTDWGTPPEPNEFERLTRLDMYNSASGLVGVARLHGTRVLEVKGFFVDEVVLFGTKLPHGQANRLRATISEWANLLLEKNLGENCQDAFWRTICADALYMRESHERTGTEHGNYRRADGRGLAAFQAWRRKRSNDHRRTTILHGQWQEPTESQEVNESKNSFHFAVESASSSRVFFITRKGYIGTGPSTVRIGDHIYVVLGSRVPFLLRPTTRNHTCRSKRITTLIPDPKEKEQVKMCHQTHSKRYSLVGDAYVHGIMDGEIVTDALRHLNAPMSVYLV